MASPVDAARATTDGSTSTTAQTLNLPGGISAGDILLTCIRTPITVGTITISGWTALTNVRGIDASDDNQVLLWKIADGTEGATVAVTLGTAARMAGLCYRITGGTMVTTDDTLAFASGTSAAPNSPSYSPYAVGHTHDTLWLSLGGIEGTRTITTQPSSYASQTIIANTGSTGNGTCSVYGASRAVTADETEDPGAWALSASDDWMIWTVAVYTSASRGRTTQLPVDVALSPTDQDARTTQLPVEVAIAPSDQEARITQVPVEVAIQTQTPLRVTQEAVEVLVSGNAKLRVTQEAVEVLVLPDTQKTRLTQLAIEVLAEVPTSAPPTFRAYIID